MNLPNLFLYTFTRKTRLDTVGYDLYHMYMGAGVFNSCKWIELYGTREVLWNLIEVFFLFLAVDIFSHFD